MKTYREVTEDGGARVLEQVVSQRNQMAARLDGIRHLVAIGSGKGGVGKSTLTVQLALALSSMGKRVSILDADFNGPTIAHMLALKAPTIVPGPDGMLVPQTPDGIGVFSTGAFLAQSEALTFPSVLTGESFVWRATKEFSSLAELLAGCDWGARDVLLIDLPPGPERTAQFVEFFGKRLKLILATVPSDVSLAVVARSIAAVQAAGGSLLGYVRNMQGYLCPETGSIKPLFPSGPEAALGLKQLGALPFDPRLAACCDRGINIAQWQELSVSTAVREIAETILEHLEAPHEVSMC